MLLPATFLLFSIVFVVDVAFPIRIACATVSFRSAHFIFYRHSISNRIICRCGYLICLANDICIEKPLVAWFTE